MVISWEQYSETQHQTITEWEYNEFECTVCGEQVSEYRKIQSVNYEAHRYREDNSCALCEYAGEECPHSSIEKEYTHYYNQSGGVPDLDRLPIFVSNDEKTHTMSVVPVYDVWCSDCGEDVWIENEVYGDRITITEEHHWGSFGEVEDEYSPYTYCTVCYIRKACDHNNYDIIEVKKEWYRSLVSFDDVAHTLVIYEYIIQACGGCGSTTNLHGDYAASGDAEAIAYTNRTVTQPHTYENGICTECGHEQPTGGPTDEPTDAPTEEPCTHPEDQLKFDCVDYWEVNIIKDITAEHHGIMVTDRYTCGNCGEHQIGIDRVQYDPHDFVAGVCSVCDYSNLPGVTEPPAECDHVTTEEIVDTAIERIEGDDRHHYAVRTYRIACACGKVSSEETRRETVGCSFGESYISSKHEDAGHRIYAECACGNESVSGYKGFEISCSDCQALGLGRGSKGERVKELQIMLAELGLYTIAIDGDFGKGTQAAVDAFFGRSVAYVDDEMMEEIWIAYEALRNPSAIEFIYIGHNGNDYNGIIEGGIDAYVGWSLVKGADHYEFAARYTDEETQVVPQQSVGNVDHIVIDGELLEYGRTIRLWVGAYMTPDAEKPQHQVRIEVPVLCSHDENVFGKVQESKVERIPSDYDAQLVHLYTEKKYVRYNCSVCGEYVEEPTGSRQFMELHQFADGKCACGYTVSAEEEKDFQNLIQGYENALGNIEKCSQELISTMKTGLVSQTIDAIIEDDEKWLGTKESAKDMLAVYYLLVTHPVDMLENVGATAEEEYMNQLMSSVVLRALQQCVVDGTMNKEERKSFMEETSEFLQAVKGGYDVYSAAKDIITLFCDAEISSPGIGDTALGGAASLALGALESYLEYEEGSAENVYAFLTYVSQMEQMLTLLYDLIPQLEESGQYRILTTCEELRASLLNLKADCEGMSPEEIKKLMEEVVEAIKEQERQEAVGEFTVDTADTIWTTVAGLIFKRAAANAGNYGTSGMLFVLDLTVLAGELANTTGKIYGQSELLVYKPLMESAADGYNTAIDDYAHTDNSVFFALLAGELEKEGLKVVDSVYSNGLFDSPFGTETDQWISSEKNKINALTNDIEADRGEIMFGKYSVITPYVD